MGGCLPCFGSSDTDKEERDGVKGGETGSKKEFGNGKEGSSVSRVSSGTVFFFSFLQVGVFALDSFMKF